MTVLVLSSADRYCWWHWTVLRMLDAACVRYSDFPFPAHATSWTPHESVQISTNLSTTEPSRC